jgi:hypothetical protein
MTAAIDGTGGRRRAWQIGARRSPIPGIFRHRPAKAVKPVNFLMNEFLNFVF